MSQLQKLYANYYWPFSGHLLYCLNVWHANLCADCIKVPDVMRILGDVGIFSKLKVLITNTQQLSNWLWFVLISGLPIWSEDFSHEKYSKKLRVNKLHSPISSKTRNQTSLGFRAFSRAEQWSHVNLFFVFFLCLYWFVALFTLMAMGLMGNHFSVLSNSHFFWFCITTLSN